MVVVTDKPSLCRELDGHRLTSTVGLVPTMGNLHAGHLRLVRKAKLLGDVVVVSLYVNPLQFGPDEDFSIYPRNRSRDIRLLEREGVDLVFAPSHEQMYPSGTEQSVMISAGPNGSILCGKSRPGHFDGVATVVAKLFNLVRPSLAIFGEKDWQQLVVIRQMVSQLDMAIDIHSERTERDEDGLALSSRNQYLRRKERARAPRLIASLRRAATRSAKGAEERDQAVAEARAELEVAGFAVEYVEVRNERNLQPAHDSGGPLRVFGAACLGKTRLIDNVPVPGSPLTP